MVIDQVETIILTGDHPALAGVGGVGQIELDGEWFNFGKYSGAGISLFLGQVEGGECVAKIFLRDDIGV